MNKPTTQQVRNAMREAARCNGITTGDSWSDKYALEKTPSNKRYVCMEVHANIRDSYELALSCNRQLSDYDAGVFVTTTKRPGVHYLRAECVLA